MATTGGSEAAQAISAMNQQNQEFMQFQAGMAQITKEKNMVDAFMNFVMEEHKSMMNASKVGARQS